MPRIYTIQPSVAKPFRITFGPLPTTWTTLVEAVDFSVPDPQQDWSERDPLDPDRRIQPGESLIETPIYIHNTEPNTAVEIQFRLFLEDETVVPLINKLIPPNETWDLLVQGLRMLKQDPDAAFGDRLQARSILSETNLYVTACGVEGSAEQHQPVAQ